MLHCRLQINQVFSLNAALCQTWTNCSWSELLYLHWIRKKWTEIIKIHEKASPKILIDFNIDGCQKTFYNAIHLRVKKIVNWLHSIQQAIIFFKNEYWLMIDTASCKVMTADIWKFMDQNKACMCIIVQWWTFYRNMLYCLRK